LIPKNSLRWAAAFLSGFILQFISPPVNLHYLHWFSFVPVLLVTSGHSWKSNFKLGYFCGFVGVFFIFNWLYDVIVLFSNLPPIVSWLLLILFSAALAIPYALALGSVGVLRKHFPQSWMFLFPALWVTLELLTPNIFPYYHGLSQYRVKWTWQLASVFGPYGLSYLILLSNATLTELLFCFRNHRPLPRRALGITLVCILATLGFGMWRYEHIATLMQDSPIVKIGRVQLSNTMQERRQWSIKEQFDFYLESSRSLANQKMDLMLWPEGAIHLNLLSTTVQQSLKSLLGSQNLMLLSGGGRRGVDFFNPANSSKRNSSFLIQSNGASKSFYDKMVLIPFGEYLPWPFTYLRGKIRGPQNIKPGDTATLFDAGKFRFTTPICYEAILDSQVQKMLGGDFLINITDDGWFGKTKTTYQHAMLAAAQSMKYGIPLIRLAVNGVSMVVLPNGEITHETKLFESVADVVEVPQIRFTTIYQKGGWLFPYLCLLVGLGAMTGVWKERRKEEN